MIGFSFSTTKRCVMRQPPLATGSMEIVHSVLSGYIRDGTVRHENSRGASTRTISFVRAQRTRPTVFLPWKRAPGAGAVAPSSRFASRHSWLHSPMRVTSETIAHTASGAAVLVVST